MANRVVHVYSRHKGWAVKKRGSKRASSLHRTQKDAIEAARQIAKAEHADLVIHRRDGMVRAWNSYGGEPYVPSWNYKFSG